MDDNLCMGGTGEVLVEGLEDGIIDRYSQQKLVFTAETK